MNRARPFDGMDDDQLMDLAKRTIVAWAAEPPGTIERAVKSAAHERIMNELKRRLVLHLGAALGLRDIDL